MNEQFAAAPKVVRPKQKYKEEEEQQEDQIKLIYNNLMWDKRIFRGNTVAPVVSIKTNNQPVKKPPPKPRVQPETTETFELGNKRANIQIFTDEFVQTLTDKPPKYEYGQQTDRLPEAQVPRHRMLVKIGTDIQTQIWDNELFDFNQQVQPLLHVLCGRTLEIARMEVLQQQELRVMSSRQQELRLKQQQQQDKIQKMYQQESHKQQQNAKKVQEYMKKKQVKVQSHRRLFSRVLAKQYLRDIRKNTLEYVDRQGFFRDPLEERLVNQVFPKYYGMTAETLQQDQALYAVAEGAQFVYSEILKTAKEVLMKEHAWAVEVQRTRRDNIKSKRQERAREKQARKDMKNQELRIVAFLADERARIAKEEQQRRLAQAKEEQSVEPVPQEN